MMPPASISGGLTPAFGQNISFELDASRKLNPRFFRSKNSLPARPKIDPQVVSLAGNPLKAYRQSLLQRGWPQVAAYLRDKAPAPPKPPAPPAPAAVEAWGGLRDRDGDSPAD